MRFLLIPIIAVSIFTGVTFLPTVGEAQVLKSNQIEFQVEWDVAAAKPVWERAAELKRLKAEFPEAVSAAEWARAEQEIEFALNRLLQDHQQKSDFAVVAQKVYAAKHHLDFAIVPTLLEQAADDLEKVSASGREEVLLSLLEFPPDKISKSTRAVIAERPEEISVKELYYRWLLNAPSVVGAPVSVQLQRAYQINSSPLINENGFERIRTAITAYTGLSDQQLKAAAILYKPENINSFSLLTLQKNFEGMRISNLAFLDPRDRAILLAPSYHNIFQDPNTTTWKKLEFGNETEWKKLIVQTQQELDQRIVRLVKSKGWANTDVYLVNEDLSGLFTLARLGFWDVPRHWIGEMSADWSPLKDSLIDFFLESKSLPLDLLFGLMPHALHELATLDFSSAMYFHYAEKIEQIFSDHPEIRLANQSLVDKIFARALQNSILNLAAVGGMESSVYAQLKALRKFATTEAQIKVLTEAYRDWFAISKAAGAPTDGAVALKIKAMLDHTLDLEQVTRDCKIEMHQLSLN